MRRRTATSRNQGDRVNHARRPQVAACEGAGYRLSPVGADAGPGRERGGCIPQDAAQLALEKRLPPRRPVGLQEIVHDLQAIERYCREQGVTEAEAVARGLPGPPGLQTGIPFSELAERRIETRKKADAYRAERRAEAEAH